MGIKEIFDELFGSGSAEQKKERPLSESSLQMQAFISREISQQVRKVLNNEFLPVIQKQIEKEFTRRDIFISEEVKRILQQEFLPQIQNHIEAQINKRENYFSGEIQRIIHEEFLPIIQNQIDTKFANRTASISDEIHRALQEEVIPEIQNLIEFELRSRPASVPEERRSLPEFVTNAMLDPISSNDKSPEIQVEPLVQVIQPATNSSGTLPIVDQTPPINPDTVPSGIDADFLIKLLSGSAFGMVEEIHPIDNEITEIDDVSEGMQYFDGMEDDEEIHPLENELDGELYQPGVDPQQRIPFQDTEVRVGFDFGTSTTAVSIKVGDELAFAIPIGSDGITRYIPSVVYINPGSGDLRSRILVGEAAENQADETNKIRSIKRCFGCEKSSGCALASNTKKKGLVPVCVIDHIQSNEPEPVTVQMIAYFIMYEGLERAIKWMCENKGVNITMESITHAPVNFGCGAEFSLKQRNVLIKIGNQLGFEKVSINNVIEEPVLAGFAFARFSENNEGLSLLYDFGGGTLDVAVIDVAGSHNEQNITVVATAGDNWLGGDDIDNLVYDEFMRQIVVSGSYSPNQIEDLFSFSDKSRLKIMAKKAKEALSASYLFEDNFFSDNHAKFKISLDIKTFEKLLEKSGLIERSLDQVLNALTITLTLEMLSKFDGFDGRIVNVSLKQAANAIKQVVLVGGVTKIPYVRRKLIDIFGESKIVNQNVIDPVSAVAIGASYHKSQAHFSIANPPFSFELKYFSPESPTSHTFQPINEAYQRYSFFDKISEKKTPKHLLSFILPALSVDASIVLRMVTTGTLVELFKLDARNRSSYILEVSLDGQVELMSGDREFGSSRLPFTHPLQDQIDLNRRTREELRRARFSISSNDDDIRQMMIDK